jgi:hypothetical protein
MTPVAETFRFEYAHQFTEDEYAEVVALLCRRPARRMTRRVILALVAVACLFWSYTLLLGVVLLVSEALAIWLPRTFPGTGARTFRESKLLGQPLTYGVSESRLWVYGPALRVEVGWKYLQVWRIREDWLALSGHHIPTLYLPMSLLAAEGLLDRVLELARTHGKAFDQPDR